MQNEKNPGVTVSHDRPTAGPTEPAPRVRAHDRRPLLCVAAMTIVFSSLVSCVSLFGLGPTEEELLAVNYTPEGIGDWAVSTPEAQGLDPLDVARLYYDAAQLETIYGLLVARNGQLVAEGYWHGSDSSQKHNLTSVTKSYMGALVGKAIEQGYIESIDQCMVDYFPEFMPMHDPRKEEITIRHLLQMRAGYPWEESSPELFSKLWLEGFHVSDVVDIPLIRDPGTDHDYSNLSSHILGLIVARATDMDLRDYGQQNLFSLIDSEVGEWPITWDYYRPGYGLIDFSARDAAKFGQLYLDDGLYAGNQVLPAAWVADSLKTYSEDAWDYRIGGNVKEIGYGYQWWLLRSGSHHYNMAWGHGGQVIMVVPDLEMVVVLTANPFFGQSDDESWRNEKANINLVADFIAGLPNE
ncbi:MAG: class C beta-lactamase-related serine hydrolase [Gemmatimonadales bacterium]|nr:MAG: class C beta-lactamase-related serine hydrolase [Gemmatimonadales bacterium]